MELYLLKSAACLGLFFAFYKLALERTTIHNFKRIYLVGSVLAAFLIPLITFISYVEVSPVVPAYSEGTPQLIFTETEPTINYWPYILGAIYGLGVVFFSVKFFRNLFTLIQKIRQNPKYRNKRFINILLSETVIPHTFFRYIFLNKQQFEKGKIPAEVMLHEEAHARQKHSFDILFVEILQIVFWFNPLFHFIKRSIKLNHEFLADRAVLNAGAETSEYQKILLTFSSNTEIFSLAHSINYASIKKRFTVMKTHTSKSAILWRSLLLLPLLSLLIYGFSTKKTVEKSPLSSFVSISDTIEDIHIKIDKNSKIELNGKTVALSNLRTEINKLNTNLSAEQKQKYLSASIDIENDKLQSAAEKVSEILYASNIRSWNVISIEGEKAAGLNHIPQHNPMAGKTTEEAEVLYQQKQAEIEKIKKARAKAKKDGHIKKDENNPWTVQVGEPVEKDKTTGKIIQQKATKAEIAEYNRLAKKYNAIDIEKRIIKKEDLARLETIYKKMTDTQKAKAQPFPECIPPPPPPPPASPKPTSTNKKGTVLNISRSKKTGFHFNTNKSTNTTLYYYKDKLIPISKANKLLDENKNLKMYISEGNFGNSIVTLSEKPVLGKKELAPPPPPPPPAPDAPKAPSAKNGNLYTAPQAPPPPNPDPVEYIKELAKRGATFHIGPHEYSADEAIKMVKKSKNDVTIDVSNYPDVILGGC